MYSLVILPEKTQLAIGKVRKKQISISVLKEYPSIFLPLVHKDKNFLEEFFQKIIDDVGLEKDKSMGIVLCQDLFLVESLTYLEQRPELLQDNGEELVGCQSTMTAYGDGKAWLYSLRKDILELLQTVVRDAGFNIKYVKSSTEILFNTLGDLTLETFILSFAREDLDVDFVNGLTGLNKFSLPLTSFPKAFENWNMEDVKEELNLHSKARNTAFSHKIKNNLNTSQQLYVVNNNELVKLDSVGNRAVVKNLLSGELLKTDYDEEELVKYLLGIGSFLILMSKKEKYVQLPPQFIINDLNFAGSIKLVADSPTDKPREYSPIRRFCRGVALIMIFLMAFMGGSLYYFSRIKNPTNVEMTKYQSMIDDNKKLQQDMAYYSKITGDKDYFNGLWQHLYLGKIKDGDFSGLSINKVNIEPATTASDDTVIKLVLEGSEGAKIQDYIDYVKKSSFFKQVELVSSEKQEIPVATNQDGDGEQQQDDKDGKDDQVSTPVNKVITSYVLELKLKSGIMEQGGKN